MPETQTQINDRMQWGLSQANDEIKRLAARLTALEGGKVLRTEPKPKVEPTLPTVTCEEHIAAQATVAAREIDTPLDLSRGMTTGRKGGN